MKKLTCSGGSYGAPRLAVEIGSGTIAGVANGKRRRDDALARYFAYRIAEYISQHEGMNLSRLGKMMGISKPEMSGLAKGENGSHQKVASIARVLKPESEDEFKQLARDWAEENPAWKPGEPLPERITRTAHPLETPLQGGSSVYSEALRDAAVALVGLAKCSPEQAREAAEKAWDRHPESRDRDYLFWLFQMQSIIDGMKKGSGERPSNRYKLP